VSEGEGTFQPIPYTYRRIKTSPVSSFVSRCRLNVSDKKTNKIIPKGTDHKKM